MELNGYGYKDYIVQKWEITDGSLFTQICNGEFILNLWDGRE